MRERYKRLLLIAIMAIFGLGAVFFYSVNAQVDYANEPGVLGNNSHLVDKATLGAIQKRNASSADLSHLANTLLPPTNSWFSGLALQKKPQTVYPLPLSFHANETGYEIGLPSVQSSPTSINGVHTAGIPTEVSTATHYIVTRYDKLSTTLSYRDGSDKTLGELTLAEGSPFVFYHLVTGGELRITGINPTLVREHSAQYVRYSHDGHDYVIAISKGASITLEGQTARISGPSDSLVTLYSLSSSGPDTLRVFSGNALSSVAVTSKQDTGMSKTTFEYKTTNGQPTLFASLPYQTLLDSSPEVASYDSIYGQMKVVPGTKFTISAPQLSEANSLNLSKLTQSHKTQIIEDLRADADSTVIDKTDSYFAGKQLARAANLLDIAEQLNLPTIATQLKTKLTSAFATRLGSPYLYYDTTIKGIAASTKAFGSEDFNDHHFHYGYFVYAASILGRYDTSFMTSYEKQINLLVADIASYEVSDAFPLIRTYDPYVGHSWAAGLAPFSDGNNQESSSEAIQAWNGVSLWGKLTHNQQLEQIGEWALSNEAHTAQATWLNVDTKARGTTNYKSPVVDINWGGKRVYSTFFSDQPGAKLGIQLIPMSPVMMTYAGDKDMITNTVKASIQNNNFNVALGDYVLMYLSLQSPQVAASLAPKQLDRFIDDGDSRTYLNSWIFSQLD